MNKHKPYCDLCFSLAEFYKSKCGSTEKAIEHVKKIGIVKIDYDIAENSVSFTVKRPGLFIGLRGKDHDALVKHLSMSIHIYEHEHINEDNIIGCLQGYDNNEF